MFGVGAAESRHVMFLRHLFFICGHVSYRAFVRWADARSTPAPVYMRASCSATMYVVFEANAPVECRKKSVVAILPTRLREDHRRVMSGSGASRSQAHRDLEDGDTVAVVVGTTAT